MLQIKHGWRTTYRRPFTRADSSDAFAEGEWFTTDNSGNAVKVVGDTTTAMLWINMTSTNKDDVIASNTITGASGIFEGDTDEYDSGQTYISGQALTVSNGQLTVQTGVLPIVARTVITPTNNSNYLRFKTCAT